MQIIADTHIHSIASTHAYSTITEIVNEAARKKLYAIALTDHSFRMPGAPGKFYFDGLSSLPDVMENVRVLKGIEVNVADFEGGLDAEPKLLGMLEWVVASMHTVTLDGVPSVELCTHAWLNIAKNPYIKVIGHSGTPYYKYDYEKVIPEFAKNGKLIEINNGSFKFRRDSMKNCAEIARICKRVGARIIVNSDAHYHTGIGQVEESLKILKEIDFPQHLIVNAQRETFKGYLKEHNIPFN